MLPPMGAPPGVPPPGLFMPPYPPMYPVAGGPGPMGNPQGHQLPPHLIPPPPLMPAPKVIQFSNLLLFVNDKK